MTAPSRATYDLEFESVGTGDPILFISGASDQRDAWVANVPAFQDRYRCITFDNRDVGKSPRAEGPYTIEDMARDTVGVLDRAGVARAHVIGHSLGSLVAQELAISAPDRVRSLVLVGSFPAADAYLRGVGQSWQTWIRTLNSFEFTKSAIYFWVGETMINAEGPDALAELVSPLIESQGTEAFCRQIDAAIAYDSRDRLHRITAPTLIVWGAEETCVPERLQQTLLAGIVDSRYVRLEAAGHTPLFEQPDALNEALSEFLASVPS